jgi:hypothetical protein
VGHVEHKFNRYIQPSQIARISAKRLQKMQNRCFVQRLSACVGIEFHATRTAEPECLRTHATRRDPTRGHESRHPPAPYAFCRSSPPNVVCVKRPCDRDRVTADASVLGLHARLRSPAGALACPIHALASRTPGGAGRAMTTTPRTLLCATCIMCIYATLSEGRHSGCVWLGCGFGKSCCGL